MTLEARVATIVTLLPPAARPGLTDPLKKGEACSTGASKVARLATLRRF